MKFSTNLPAAMTQSLFRVAEEINAPTSAIIDAVLHAALENMTLTSIHALVLARRESLIMERTAAACFREESLERSAG